MRIWGEVVSGVLRFWSKSRYNSGKLSSRGVVMFRLPLFPLNTVLFPMTPVRLHIFEERYRLMIGKCVENREPFGVVALRHGAEVESLGAQADPYAIGCTALITEHQRLYDGRMNIVAMGQQRFRILQLDRSQPYLQGIVEPLPIDLTPTPELISIGNKLRPWLERYFRLLVRAENIELDAQNLPTNPVELSFLSASILRVSLPEKQKLLASDTMLDLNRKLIPYYRKEATLLELMLAPERVREEGPFSLN